MKKKSLYTLVLISVCSMLGFSSCKKCVECKSQNSSNSNIQCKPEEFTNKAWNLYLDEYEDNGYDCDPVGI